MFDFFNNNNDFTAHNVDASPIPNVAKQFLKNLIECEKWERGERDVCNLVLLKST